MANSAFTDAAHSFNSHNNVSVTSVATNDILKFDGTNWVNTTISHSTIDVTQSNHGFVVGNVVRSSGSNGAYAKAQANSAANAEVVGIVTVRTDANNFTLTLNGLVTVADAVPNSPAGTALFLHQGGGSDEGTLTATEPSSPGEISKPVAIVTTQNAAMILISHRGETISTGVSNWDVNGAELVLDADADTSITADTDDQIDIKISGADDFRFTANNFNILSGSTLTVDSGATITNSGTANGFGGGPTEAADTDMENEGSSNANRYVSPEIMKYHPGVAKVWIRFYQSNSSHTMGASYGVASIADGGAAGFSDFTWSTAFSSAEYAILASAEAASVAGMEAGSKAAGTVTMRFWDMNGTYNDALHASVACFGEL